MEKKRRRARVDERLCVGCGSCINVCPRNAISVPKGIFAVVSDELCIGCGICAKACPASIIAIEEICLDKIKDVGINEDKKGRELTDEKAKAKEMV